jgi:hypothetical protein
MLMLDRAALQSILFPFFKRTAVYTIRNRVELSSDNAGSSLPGVSPERRDVVKKESHPAYAKVFYSYLSCSPCSRFLLTLAT